MLYENLKIGFLKSLIVMVPSLAILLCRVSLAANSYLWQYSYRKQKTLFTATLSVLFVCILTDHSKNLVRATAHK